MRNYLLGYVFFFILLCQVTASAEIITLKNGDSLHISVIYESDSHLTVRHASLGRLYILREEIVSIKEASLGDVSADRGILNTGWLAGWERRLEIGLDGSAGNSQNETFRSTIDLKYEDDKSRWHSETLYYVSADDNETSENKAYSNLTKDWLIKDSKWFYFSFSGIDWDEFKDWDYRFRSAAGPGYQFIKTDKWDALARLGLGVKHVTGDDVNDETTMEALVGFAVTRNIKDRHRIECSNTLFPSLTNTGEYRNVSDFNWYISFDYVRGFGLKVGLRNEYDSTLTSKNDADYYVSLTWDF